MFQTRGDCYLSVQCCLELVNNLFVLNNYQTLYFKNNKSCVGDGVKKYYNKTYLLHIQK